MKRLSLLLIILSGSPLFAYDAELWTHFTNQNIVTSIAEGESEIYFGTSGGIRRYHRFRQAWLSPITTADGLPDNLVLHLSFDKDTGDLNIRTKTGSARWMSRLDALSPGIFMDAIGRRPIPRIPNVVPPFGYYVNGDIIRGPHRTYRILDALVDSWNVLWLATEGLGVGRADLTFNELAFLQSGPIVSNVTAVGLDGETVWVGGQDGFGVYARGISRFDRGSADWTYYAPDDTPRLDDTQVSGIAVDEKDVWFGTDEGLVRYRKDQDAWDTYLYRRGSSTNHVRNTTAVARGKSRVWLGTERGLALLDLESDTLRAVPGSHNFRIRGLAVGEGFIWAATHKGLFRSRLVDATWAPVKSHQAAGRPILAVDASGDTTWALATSPPELLVSHHPDSTWRSQALPEVAGTGHATISGEGDRVWVGMDNGVIRVNTNNGRTSALTDIDGLMDPYVNVVKLEGPDVWIGTRSGLSLYRWKDDFRDPED